jgi:glycosyltransferase involved in cell wall biosynthesis
MKYMKNITSISSQSEKQVVGIVVASLENKGPVNVVRAQIAHGFSGQFSYVVIVLGGSVDPVVAAEISSLGVEVETIQAGGVLGKARVLARLVRSRNMLIVHSHGATADLVNALARGPFHKVTTVHNCLLEDYVPLFGKVRGAAYFAVHFLAYLFIGNRVACSSAVGHALKKYSLRHQVIANGVNTAVYYPLPIADKAALRKKYQVDTGGIVYVYCGSFINRKNVEFLLGNLKLQADDVLLMAGEGELLAECRQIAGDDKRYRFLGQVQSCAELYQLADCFVSASKSEGLPLAVLEAYSCGAVLLLSDIPSHREIANNCEGKISLFPIDRAGPFEVAPHMLSYCRDYSRSEFSATRMATAYQFLYATLTKSTAPQVAAQVGSNA